MPQLSVYFYGPPGNNALMIEALARDIKFNCNVSDARHWGSFSICGLLMRYRDLYRSEQQLEPWGPIAQEDISRWIEQKETQWPALEEQAFRDLPLSGRHWGPCDLTDLNKELNPRGLVYGAGYGMYLKPTFFLAELRAMTEVEGHTVYTTGRELARDLFTSPAMLQGRSIALRMEPLSALLWDRYSQIAPNRCSILETAFRAYGIEPGRRADGLFQERLSKMTIACAGILLRHELAESREGVPAWKDIIASAEDRLVEQYLRALQDIVADTSEKGPLQRIIADQDEGAFALSMGLLEGYHRLLLADLITAFGRFSHDRNWSIVDDVRSAACIRARADRRTVLDLAASGSREDLRAGLRTLMQRSLAPHLPRQQNMV